MNAKRRSGTLIRTEVGMTRYLGWECLGVCVFIIVVVVSSRLAAPTTDDSDDLLFASRAQNPPEEDRSGTVRSLSLTSRVFLPNVRLSRIVHVACTRRSRRRRLFRCRLEKPPGTNSSRNSQRISWGWKACPARRSSRDERIVGSVCRAGGPRRDEFVAGQSSLLQRYRKSLFPEKSVST